MLQELKQHEAPQQRTVSQDGVISLDCETGKVKRADEYELVELPVLKVRVNI